MAEKHLLERLQVVRDNYVSAPWIEPRADETPLVRSWQRSEAAGLGPDDNVAFELVRRSVLSEIDDRHAALIRMAKPETERLARALRHTDCSVLLVNNQSVIIDRLIDENSARKPLQAVSRKGVNLDEHCIGTTAPSIALSEGIPYLVGMGAHYAANNRGFFCVAAPIDNPLGERVGALSIAAFESVPGFDVLSLVVHAATGIENSFFAAASERLIIHFHARAELVGTPMEGIIAIDGGNRIVGVNRSALRLLCVARSQLLGTDFNALMDFDLSRHLSLRNAAPLSEMQSRSGLQLYVRLSSGNEAAARPADLLGGSSRSASSHRLAPIDPQDTLRAAELKLMQRALADARGNVTAAARQLGISRSSIYRRLAEARESGL